MKIALALFVSGVIALFWAWYTTPVKTRHYPFYCFSDDINESDWCRNVPGERAV